MRAAVVWGAVLLLAVLAAGALLLLAPQDGGLADAGGPVGETASDGPGGGGLAPLREITTDAARTHAGSVTRERTAGEAGGDGGATHVPPVLLLTGRVTAKGGGPIDQAQVAVSPTTGSLLAVHTAADGSFEVHGPPGDMPRVLVSAREHAGRVFRDVPEGTRLQVQLEPGVAFLGIVSGLDGKPVAGAALTLTPRGREDLEPLTTRSDEKGSFRFESVAAGRYDVSVLKEELAPYHENDLIIPPDGLVKGFLLFPGLKLHGQVLSADGKYMIQGAQVEVVDRIIRGMTIAHQSQQRGPFVTDQEGRFEIPALAPGEVRLMTKAQGYAADVRAFVLKRLEEERNSLVIKLKQASGVTGRVLDPEGNPLGWARVTVEPKDGKRNRDFPSLVGFLFGTSEFSDDVGDLPPAVTADAQGRFVLSGSPVGRGWLQAFDPKGRFAPSHRKEVRMDRPGTLLEVELQLQLARAVTGTVRDGEGQPVEEALVAVGPTRIRTAADGTFVIQPVAEGQQVLRVRHPHFELHREVVQVGAGGLSGVEVQLRSGNVLHGQVADRRGQPIYGAHVLVMDLKRRQRLGFTRSEYDGSFYLGGLKTDRVWVRVAAEGYLAAVFKELGTGPKPLAVRLDDRSWEATGDLVGTVVKAGSGTPVFDFQITGLPPHKLQIFQGTFFAQNLNPGLRSFNVQAPGFQRERVTRVEVIPGKRVEVPPVALHLAQRLRLSILDSRGRVLRNGRVRIRLTALEHQKNPGWTLRPRRPGRKDRWWTFPELRRGRYRVEIRFPNHARTTTTANLRNNVDRVIRLRRMPARKRRK